MNKREKTIPLVWLGGIVRLVVLLISFSVLSCVDEKPVIPKPIVPEEALVRLTINAPGASLPTRGTRASGDMEFDISEIMILVFEEEEGDYKFRYMTEGSQIKPDEIYPQKTSFTARLRTSDTPIKLLFVANAGTIFNSYTPAYEENEENVRRSMVAGFNGSTLTAIPMFGEKILPSLDATAVNTISLPVLRSVARVDVIVDLDVSSESFVIESLYIFRANNKLQAVPDTDKTITNSGALEVTDPSIPSSATPANYYSKMVNFPGESFIEKLYVSEAASSDDPSVQQTGVTCVVVGGYYKGETIPTFYRADFNSGNAGYSFGQVLRNYRYEFVIKEVTASGWPTPEDAANNRSTLMVVDVREWEDFTMEMRSNGDNYLGVSTRDLKFFYQRDLQKVVNVEANVPYSISWVGSDETVGLGEGTVSNTWFSAEVVKYPDDNEDISRIVVTTLTENNGGSIFTSQLKVNYAGWTFIINVSQGYYAEHATRGIRVLSASIGHTGNLGNTPIGSSDADPLRRILSNKANFSPTGTVNFFAGFSFNATPNNLWTELATPTNEYGAWLRNEIFSADIFFLANENKLSAYGAEITMQWLEGAPNRFLIVAGDGDLTSNHLLRADLGGLLSDRVDWYYNAQVSGPYHHEYLGFGVNYVLAEPTPETIQFYNGPFGQVGTDSKFLCYDGYFGFAKSYHSDIIPILRHPNPKPGSDAMVVGLDKKKRILYMGDCTMFQKGVGLMNGGPVTQYFGTVESVQDAFWANVWAWLAEQIIWPGE